LLLTRKRTEDTCERESPFSGEVEVDESFLGARQATLQAVSRGKLDLESTIHSDGWTSYNGLMDLGHKKHYRVQHGNNEFANETSHVNEIGNFWGITKIHLSKFRGLSKSTFYLQLKECELRLNHRGQNLYKLLLKIIRKPPFN
jgi:transposase-like protein